MRIDCTDCAFAGTDACADCVVTVLVDRDERARVLDLDTARALRVLGEEGLVPSNRHTPRREAG